MPPRCGCAGGDGTVSPLTLRFPSRSVEAAFLAQRRTPLLRSCKALLPIPLVFYALGVIMNLLMSKHSRSSFPTDAAFESQQAEIACDSVMLLITAIFLALLHCERLVGKMGTLAIELGITILMTLVMTTLALSAPQTVSRLLGQDMAATYGEGWYGSDSSLVLKIDIVVTGAHLGPKVRWCLLLPLALLAVLLYAVNAFVIGSAESMGDTAYNMLLLTCLIVTASVAKRVAELGERDAFRAIIQEKSLRFNAEYRLSQTKSGKGGGGGAESSVPSCAASAHVFDPMYQDDVDMHEQLARVAAMGDQEHWLIDSEEVKPLEDEHLGSGSFGDVACAVFCGLLVAVKRPTCKIDKESLRQLPSFCNELRILRHLRHPNIVATLGAIVDPQALKIAIVLELVQGVTLDKFMRSVEAHAADSNRTILARYQVMLGVCRALVYMHTRRPHLVHGDLKGQNVMVDIQDGAAHPKLLDFGLSRIITRRTRALGGSLIWMAPEVLHKSGPVSCSADLYSFGRLLAFVATSIPPFAGLTVDRLTEVLESKTPPQPDWPAGCVFTPHLKQTVRSCTSVDPRDRPSIVEVHEHLLGLSRELNVGGPRSIFLETVQSILAASGRRQEKAKEPPPDDPSGNFGVLPGAVPQPGVESPGVSLPDELMISLREPLQASAGEPAGEPLQASSDAKQTGVLLYPDKLATSVGAMAVSLLELVTRWNCSAAEAPCCQMHPSVRVAQQLLEELSRRPCIKQSWIELGGQCTGCGLLGLERNAPVCQICRSEEKKGSTLESTLH